jgi:hypothetical protein
MKHNITGSKVGTSVSIMIDFRAYKKIFATPEEANLFFIEFLKEKKIADDQSVKNILMHLNKKARKAHQNGLEYDEQTGLVYLTGFNSPVPDLLVKTIEDYHKNGFPKENIINFWKLLMVNPDKRVRESLFQFLSKFDFAITDNGYFVTYKAVETLDTQESTDDLNAFVAEATYRVRKDWKKSPSKFCVYLDLNDNTYHITNESTYENWDEEEKNVEMVGNLKSLEDKMKTVYEKDGSVKYIPIHVKKRMSSFDIAKETVRLGVPQQMQRKECNSDPAVECSYGLHVGSTPYVRSFASSTSTILVCLVNPAHVIAVPEYDRSKMRVCEYFPIAITTRDENGDINSFDQSYYESDYMAYEKEELERQIEAINNEEKRVTVDTVIAEDERSIQEVLSILSSRVVDLTTTMEGVVDLF